MMTHDVDKKGQENISPEIIDGFQLVSNVISQSGLEERCKNLDKRREKPYWTLPEEEMARAFEVYLKEKLKERGIQNDYLVNYRSEESWAKATENGFQMENTYPYPSATEIADIKAAFDYLFDSIRFKYGRYDDDRDILYLNGKSETSLDWAF